MIDDPQITRSSAQRTAIIRITVPRAQIHEVMGPGCQELMATLAAQGVAPAGPLYTHHLRMDPEVFDFELGVPVSAAVHAAGRVQPGELPEAMVARAMYQGPYERLGAAWAELEKWIAATGHRSAPDLWERYIAGPESGQDSSQWRTELNRRLRQD
jgi:effector-binding domain-containing protein